MTLNKKILCIVCPKGCSIEVSNTDGEYLCIGQGCKRGVEYVLAEIKDKRRIVTSTVSITGGEIKRLPVVTSEPVPFDLVFDVMDVIHHTHINAPVRIGAVIVKNILNTGIDVIGGRDVPLRTDNIGGSSV